MNLIHRFVPGEFTSYEDFYKNFRLEVPPYFNFGYDVVDEYARLVPDKRALLYVGEDDIPLTFTFAQMKALSDRAAGLLKSLGLRRGDAAMVMLKQRYEFWILAVAMHKLGVILIPATHQLTTKDIVYRVGAADVRMILCVGDEAVVHAVEAARPDCPTLSHCATVCGLCPPGWLDFHTALDAAQPLPTPAPADRPHGQEPMLLYFTSGTTGLPKMVLQDFTYPLGHIVTAAYWQNVQDDGLHLTVADTGWAKCAWGKIYGQWIAGTALFIYDYDRFDPMHLMDKICEYQVTTLCAPATVYRFLIKEDLSGHDFSHLTYAAMAGEPLNPEVQAQFTRATGGIHLMEAYGQSETTPIAATFKWMAPKPGSIGKPNPAYRIALLDEDGNTCSVGEEGEVCIDVGHGKPVGLFNLYYRDEERTRAVWHDGYYHTGDVAWQDEQGYLWFVGRTDDVIKSSGYRIGPFEVESVLMEHPAVLECAVTAYPHPIRGQVVKATIVCARGYTPCDELAQQLKDYVKANTAPYKYPRMIVFVDELPKTISGKIRRKDIVHQDRMEYEARQGKQESKNNV